MTHDRDDAGDDALAGIDLQLWRVPPPAPVDRPALLVGALTPAAAPAKRTRLAWILAAIVILNAAIATLIVIIVARPAATQTTVVQAAGGGSVDAEVRILLARLEQEQRELERKLTEIQELRALVLELSERVRKYEQQDGRRDRTAPKDPAPPTPAPTPPTPARVAPRPVESGPCDEVSCVLSGGACCAKFGRPVTPVRAAKPAPDGLPDNLDRQSISSGISAVKARVMGCGSHSTAKGLVKVRVRVGGDGRVTNVSIERTPDPALAACVAAAVQQATFERTHDGGSFSYPFVF